MKMIFLGPFAQKNRTRRYVLILLVLLLSVLTQVGGIFIWPFLSMNPDNIGWKFRLQRWLYPIGSYLIGTQLVLPLLSPLWGMTALSCSKSTHLRAHSIRTCLFNRNYIQNDAATTLTIVEQNMERMFPRVPILYLDAGFPLPYIHMLPHLNHSKGTTIDLAFLWQNPTTKAYNPPPSPIGYGGFSAPEQARKCHPYDTYFIVGQLALVLRWDYTWLQPIVSNAVLDSAKTKILMGVLDKQKNIKSITLEPHLHDTLATPKTIANSCKVARHDDHIHVLFTTSP